MRKNIKRSDLAHLLKLINNASKAYCKHDQAYDLCFAYGGVRMVNASTRRTITPRTTKTLCFHMMDSFLEGIESAWRLN